MIGVIGSGSWATALIKILLEKEGRELHWWVRNEAARQAITSDGHNPRHLTSVALDHNRLHLSGDLHTVVERCDELLLAVPSAYLGATLSQLPPATYQGKRFVSAVKGSVPERGSSVSHYLEHELGIPQANICMVSGPSHAEEVAEELPTFLTVASTSEVLAHEVAGWLNCSYCHTSLSQDIEGIEYCVLAKNIYAIAAGLCRGLGYGDNLCAVLTCAAMKELGRQLEHRFALTSRRLADSCYLGDLMVTCWSPHSRNRALGMAVARGEKPEQVFAHCGSVAEGYYSVKNMHALFASQGVLDEIPIAEAVYRILYEGAEPKNEINMLIDNML